MTPIDIKYLKPLKALIFPGKTYDIPSNFLWTKLTKLVLCNCGLSSLDQSFHFFPFLYHLDLSYNTISFISHLQDCISLKYLNISHNKITNLAHVDRVLGSITILDLSHNKIDNINGIDKIYSLQSVDLSYNSITQFKDIQYLSKLPCLESLKLIGNSISDKSNYRLNVFQELNANTKSINRF